MITQKRFFLFLCVFSLAGSTATAVPKNLLLDNFENASGKNLMGGYIGSDIAYPGVCRFSFTWAPQNTFGKASHSLQVDYDVRAPGSYTYLWLHLGPEGPDGKIQTMDLRGMAYLSFWVKASKAGENFKVELHCDTNQNGRFDAGEDASSQVYVDRYLGTQPLKDQWRKVVIPLSDFSALKDLSRAIEIVIVFENLRGNRQGTIFLDEVLLGCTKPPASKEPAILPSPKTMLPPSHVLAGGTNVALTARLVPCNVLEGVGFEVSWDEGKSWYLAGIDYETSADSARVSWNVPALPWADKVLMRSFAQGIRGQRAEDAVPLELHVKGYTDAELIQELSRRSFLYFLDNQDPDTGLFPDSNGGDASTAVAGFGLAALAVGAHEGWIDVKAARLRALKTLQTYALLQQGESVAEKLRQQEEKQKEAVGRRKKEALEDMLDFETTRAVGGGILTTLAQTPQALAELLFGKVPPSQDGFFYHFMKMRTAARAGSSEISVVDTALFLLGALTAGEYFGGDVKALAEKIYQRAQWGKFYDAQAKSFYLAWSPEKGYSSGHWDYYTDEAMLIHILAAGSASSKVPADAFYGFRREKGRFGDGDDFIYSWSGALFTHQYAAAWLDLRGMRDKQGCDWWENSRKAVMANRDFCWRNQERPQAYGPHRWGISGFHRPEGYTGHFGIMPNGSGQAQEDGTISPIACASAMTFLPFEAMADIKYQLATHPFLLGPYGLRNAYNLQRNWFSNVDFGLDTGLLLLSLENFNDDLVWKTLRKNPFVRRGLGVCGFKAQPKKKNSNALVLSLPPVPESAPQEMIVAQDCAQRMENLCAKSDKGSYAEFLKISGANYAQALSQLDAIRGASPWMMAHIEWLRSLVALRQASPVDMRRHFGKMLQRFWDISPDAQRRLRCLRRYLDYICAMDLRDFQEGTYAAFERDAEESRDADQLEDFARYCQSNRRFMMAVRAWRDALSLRRKMCGNEYAGNRAREIAEGFLGMDRFEEAALFDRMYLEHVHVAGGTDPDLDSRLCGLAQRYRKAGIRGFSKECYIAAANLPLKRDKGQVLYELAKLEEAAKNHAKAVDYFKAILQGHPNGSLAEYAEFGLALNNLLLDKNPGALHVLESFLQKYPDSLLRDDAAFQLGIAYFENKKFDQAKKYLQSISSQNEELCKRAENFLGKIK